MTGTGQEIGRDPGSAPREPRGALSLSKGGIRDPEGSGIGDQGSAKPSNPESPIPNPGPFHIAVMLPCVVFAALSAWWTVAGLWPPDDVTLSEAIATRNTGEALRLIAEGADPDAAFRVRDGLLVNGHDAVVTPVEAAVGAQRAEALRQLLAYGAVIDDHERLVLRCYERTRRDSGVRALLDEGAAGEPDCAGVTLPVDRKE